MTNARKTDANKPTSKFTKVSASIKLAGADVTSGMMNGRHYDRRQNDKYRRSAWAPILPIPLYIRSKY